MCIYIYIYSQVLINIYGKQAAPTIHATEGDTDLSYYYCQSFKPCLVPITYLLFEWDK